MLEAIVTYRDGETSRVPLVEDAFREGIRHALPALDYTNVLSVAFAPYHKEIREGDEGYFVFSHSTQDEPNSIPL